MRIAQGSGYRIPTTVQQRNIDGTYTLVDPGAITGTLQYPDLTTTGFTPTKDSVGQYHADLAPATLSQTGAYRWKVVTTGTGAGVAFGSFAVYDPFAGEIVPLEDIKQQLNIATTTTDSELRDYITAASAVVDLMCGPVIPRTVTETLGRPYLGTWALVVSQAPIISVTSIVSQLVGGQTYAPADLLLNTDAGIIQILAGGYFYGTLTVTYVAGRALVPPALNMAARIIVQHMWETQRGPTSRPGLSGDDTSVIPGLGYAVPNRALELLKTCPRVPAMA